MQRASQENIEWKRHKEVNVPWATYDAHRSNECKRIIDLRELLHVLDKPVHRKEFKLSQLTILLLLEIMCDGNYDLDFILKTLNVDMDKLQEMVEGLVKDGYIKFISDVEVEVTDQGLKLIK